MFKVDPILDAAKPDGGEGKQSSREIRLNDRLVDLIIYLKDYGQF